MDCFARLKAQIVLFCQDRADKGYFARKIARSPSYVEKIFDFDYEEGSKLHDYIRDILALAAYQSDILSTVKKPVPVQETPIFREIIYWADSLKSKPRMMGINEAHEIRKRINSQLELLKSELIEPNVQALYQQVMMDEQQKEDLKVKVGGEDE